MGDPFLLLMMKMATGVWTPGMSLRSNSKRPGTWKENPSGALKVS
ncbi:hypothetical protein [Sphingobium cloacae]|nr:hypothetical protein [Sphingobium cloacae]